MLRIALLCLVVLTALWFALRCSVRRALRGRWLWALVLLAPLVTGCSAPGLPIAPTTQELPVCASPEGQLLAYIAACPSQHTADGLTCHVCRDYAGCIVGRGEAADYCVDARLGCADPACAF